MLYTKKNKADGRTRLLLCSSWSKIEDKGKDKPAELDSQESWQQLASQTIVAHNCLQENLVKSVSCQFCHTDVTLLENVSIRSGLGSSWIVSCQNEHCPSRNSSENYFLTDLVAQAVEFKSCKGYFPPGASFEPAL